MSRRSCSVMARTTRGYFRLNYGILTALFAMGTFLAILRNIFLTKTSMMSLLRTCTTNCYLATRVQLTIILAGIDLIRRALATLNGVMCVMTFESLRFPISMGVVVGTLVGTFVGSINDVIITYTGIHPFVVTLTMQSVCRGAVYLITNGSSVITEDTNFNAFGTGSLGVVPYPVIYMTIFLIMDYFLLDKLRIGRYIYAVGGNELSTRSSGIGVKKIKILVWTISGTIAGFCGVVLVAKLFSGQPSAGEGYETDAIAAVVLRGTSFFGGIGTVGGLMIGILITGVISNGLNLMHVNSYQQFVLEGAIIIAAAYFDILEQKKQSTSK